MSELKTKTNVSVQCSFCGRTVITYTDGTLAEHRDPKKHRRCKGSNEPKPRPALEDPQTLGASV
jgi:hypothetical protein